MSDPTPDPPIGTRDVEDVPSRAGPARIDHQMAPPHFQRFAAARRRDRRAESRARFPAPRSADAVSPVDLGAAA